MEVYYTLLVFICLQFPIIKKTSTGFWNWTTISQKKCYEWWFIVQNYFTQAYLVQMEAGLWNTNYTVSMWKRPTSSTGLQKHTHLPWNNPTGDSGVNSSPAPFTAHRTTPAPHVERQVGLWIGCLGGGDWLSQVSFMVPAIILKYLQVLLSTFQNSPSEEAWVSPGPQIVSAIFSTR